MRAWVSMAKGAHPRSPSTTTAAYALLALLNTAFGVGQNTVLTLVCLLVFIICTLLISGLGHATIMWINKWATVVFGVLNLIVMGFLVATVDYSVSRSFGIM